MFLYEDIQWGDSDTSIGFNAGDGERFFTLMTAGVLDLESSSNVGIPGTFLFRVDQAVEVPGKLKQFVMLINILAVFCTLNSCDHSLPCSGMLGPQC
jgi:hypothetical protein